MRKAKRIVALVLALTMMFALMAMTASAATPKAGYSCSSCGSTNTSVSLSEKVARTKYVASCSSVPGSHYHIIWQQVRTITCHDCQYSYSYNYGSTRETCGGGMTS